MHHDNDIGNKEGTFAVCVAGLMETNPISGNLRPGHCSSLLTSMKKGCRVMVDIHSNKAFTLPCSYCKSNVILVATGTGLAPFRGFMSDRADQLGSLDVRPNPEEYAWELYYGCRSPNDFLYLDDLQMMERNGALNRMTVTYSRGKPTGTKYVQDALLRDSGHIWDIIDRYFPP